MSEPQRPNADRPAECRADLRSYLDIGRITAPHGVQGEVRVLPLTDSAERFESLQDCFLTSPDERQRRPVRLSRTRLSPPFVLVAISGVETREAAEQLRGWYLSVDRAHAVELPENTWFVCDLLGVAVIDAQYGELGHLKDVLQQTAQDIYVVAAPGKPDLLFPAAGGFVRRVSLEERRMDVSLPDGLVEVYRPEKPARSQPHGKGGRRKGSGAGKNTAGQPAEGGGQP